MKNRIRECQKAAGMSQAELGNTQNGGRLMRIDLDEHYSIELNKWGDPVLIKHKVNAELDKNGHLIGAKLYFQTFGQAVKSYIKVAASESKIKSFQEMAALIDGKLKGVELKIDQMMEDD